MFRTAPIRSGCPPWAKHSTWSLSTKRSRAGFACFAFLIIAAISARADDDIIARVGDQEIRASQVSPYLENLGEPDRTALLKNPAALSQAVRTLILQQVLFKEAVASGWDKTPDVVAQLERLRQGAVAETYLQSIAKVPDGYPAEEEVKTVYEARKADLQVPAQIRLAQIYVAVPKDAPKDAQDKARARVEEISKAAKSGDFSAVARDKSEEHETASRGGEVGWLAETQIQPEIRSKVASLSKGTVTEPVRLADGWYVVKVLDVRPAHTATLDEVRDQLVRALRNDRARANREAYLSKLQQQNPIALDELGLSKLFEGKK